MTSVLTEYFTFNIRNQPTIGDTKTSITNQDHIGWLRCDGRILNVSDFYQLYQVIGDSFSNTAYTLGTQFQLPDARGRVSGFVDLGTGLTRRALGSNFGTETHTLTIAEMPTHGHSSNANSGAAGLTSSNATNITIEGNAAATGRSNVANGGVGLIRNSDGASDNTTRGSITVGLTSYSLLDSTAGEPDLLTTPKSIVWTDPTHAHSINPQGGSNAHNNMQPTIFMGNMFLFSGKATYNAPYAGMGVNTSPSSDGSFVFPYT
jgi:hypothetical protein